MLAGFICSGNVLSRALSMSELGREHVNLQNDATVSGIATHIPDKTLIHVRFGVR
jgi:hypothetical protein